MSPDQVTGYHALSIGDKNGTGHALWDGMNWTIVWSNLSIFRKWQAFKEYRGTRPTVRALPEFMKLGPYTRCSWVRQLDSDDFAGAA